MLMLQGLTWKGVSCLFLNIFGENTVVNIEKLHNACPSGYWKEDSFLVDDLQLLSSTGDEVNAFICFIL